MKYQYQGGICEVGSNQAAIVKSAVIKFIEWLTVFGETSFDHQSFYAGPVGRRAKELYYQRPVLGILAVSPMVFFEAFLPSTRKLFWKKIRLPIADAHYAMGFSLLYKITRNDVFYKKTLDFLNILVKTRSEGYLNFCWGYPFDWVTRKGTVRKGTPLITITPYAYEAFDIAYSIDKNPLWLEIMRSIAEHCHNDIRDLKISANSASSGYFPGDNVCGVVNASAYRAFLLTQASVQFNESKYRERAESYLNFVLRVQRRDGSWPYAVDGKREFVDHFHTCFVLKGLVKIEKVTRNLSLGPVIEKGIKFYLTNLFDDRGLPKPFSKAPRLTVYRNELYDYAECINLCLLLFGRYQELDDKLNHVVADLLERWQKSDGSFRSRKLIIGWDNVPMHRWGQSQIFRSLCFLFSEENSLG